MFQTQTHNHSSPVAYISAHSSPHFRRPLYIQSLCSNYDQTANTRGRVAYATIEYRQGEKTVQHVSIMDEDEEAQKKKGSLSHARARRSLNKIA
jgi:hypothetical protein